MYKTRDLEKERETGKQSSMCNTWKKDNSPVFKCLFGWQAIPDNARNIVITEGEIDAMSYFEQGFPALSVPFGGGGGNKQDWIENEYDHLQRFDKIYISMDTDEVGEEAIKEIIKRIGRQHCYIIKLPLKDANECLQKGIKLKEFVESARTSDPPELKNAAEFTDEVIELFYPTNTIETGAQLPWNIVRDRFYIKPGDTTIWTGTNGHGKSLILNQIILDLATQKQRTCLASMEMYPKRTLHRFYRQLSGETRPAKEDIPKLVQWTSPWFWLFNVVGSTKADKIMEIFLYARKRYNITHFVIDSLLKCGFAEDDFAGQKKFMDTICDFAMDNDCHVHVVAHSRKLKDEDEPVGKLDVKGSGGLTDLASNVMVVWRNKKKEKEIVDKGINEELRQKADALLICEKQRNFEWEGSIKLWFDHSSLLYRDEEDRPNINYLGD